MWSFESFENLYKILKYLGKSGTHKYSLACCKYWHARSEAKKRNGARIIIKDEDDEAGGDNFLMNEINVNEHYVNREDIKKPKLKNKKR